MLSHPTTNLAERLWFHVDKSAGPDGCWPWLRSCIKSGYGQLRYHKRHCYTHRLAYELTFGPIPEGLEVMHTCDNPPCCNPAHLKIGSHADNVVDMYQKGRHQRHSRLGESHHATTLTAAQVREIRAAVAQGFSQRQVGTRFGVSSTTIANIARGKTWSHIT